MENEVDPTWKIENSLRLASLSVGAYHGYCNAQGILPEGENLKFALTYGPAIVRGVFDGMMELSMRKDSTLEKIAKERTGTMVFGASAGVVFGGIIGGVHTLVGYMVGYMVGYTTGCIAGYMIK